MPRFLTQRPLQEWHLKLSQAIQLLRARLMHNRAIPVNVESEGAK